MEQSSTEVERAGSDAATDATAARRDRAHLEDVEDGCGCTEMWEHLSERRAED